MELILEKSESEFGDEHEVTLHRYVKKRVLSKTIS